MKHRLLILLVYMLGTVTFVYGNPDFIKGGFAYDILHGGPFVIISKAYTSGMLEEIFREEFCIPSSVEYQGRTYKVKGVGDDGFSGCTEIRNLVVDDGVEFIGKNAFANCVNLLSVEIPSSICAVDGAAFWGCRNLETIKVASNNACLDSRDNCNGIINSELDELVVTCVGTTIPSTVKSIGQSAFNNRSDICEVVIPEGVRKIDGFAFSGCINLKHIAFPSSLEVIGEGVFSGCKSLKSLYIPRNVRKIESDGGVGMFAGCDSLETVVVDKGNPFYDSRKGCNAIVETESSKLIAGCAISKLVESLKDIGEYAFAGTGIREIHIPQSMTGFAVNAFCDCDALSRLTVHKDNPLYCSPNACNAVIRKDSAILVLGCVGTVIPEWIKVIGENAFLGRPIAKYILDLPVGLEEIRSGAFCLCDNIFELIIPSSVTSIGMSAFSRCPKLAVVRMSGLVKELEELLFADCSNLSVIDIPEGVSVIRWFAFHGCSKLNHVIFPSSLTLIEDGAFSGCPCEEDIKKLNLH